MWAVPDLPKCGIGRRVVYNPCRFNAGGLITSISDPRAVSRVSAISSRISWPFRSPAERAARLGSGLVVHLFHVSQDILEAASPFRRWLHTLSYASIPPRPARYLSGTANRRAGMYSVARWKELTRGVALFSSSLLTLAGPTHDCVLRRRINLRLEVGNKATHGGQAFQPGLSQSALDPGCGGVTMGGRG
jgi:hypothetical protein